MDVQTISVISQERLKIEAKLLLSRRGSRRKYLGKKPPQTGDDWRAPKAPSWMTYGEGCPPPVD